MAAPAGILRAEGMVVSPVYGAMDMEARRNSVGRFHAGKSGVLLVTDVAARGIDIPLLDCAINYDFPPRPKLFVHRVGRVARAGRAGTAYSLLTRDELGYLLDLHLFLGRRVEPASAAPASVEAAQARAPRCGAPRSLFLVRRPLFAVSFAVLHGLSPR